MSAAVDSAGNVTAQQSSLPYGDSRYTSGTLPTSKGYTGQRADAATGLDYYGARYYDSVLGQFTSADDVLPGDGLDPWGLSRYAYVEGNPIARNDKDGHCLPWCIIAGAAIGALVGTITAIQNHEDLRTALVHVALDTTLGAGAGLALAANPAAAGVALGMTLVGIAAFSHDSHGGKFNLDKAFQTAAIGTMAGALGGALGGQVATVVGDGAAGALAGAGSAGTRILMQGAVQGAIGGTMDAAGQYVSNRSQGQDAVTAFKNINPGEVIFVSTFSAVGGSMMQRIIEGGMFSAEAASSIAGVVQGTPNILTAGPSSYDYPSQSTTNGYSASVGHGANYSTSSVGAQAW